MMSDFDALLVTESKACLWDAEVRGIKLWAGIRFNIIQTMLASKRDYAPEAKGQSRWHKLHPRLWNKYLKMFKWLLGNKQHTSICFKHYRDNGVHRYLYERISNPLIVEESWFGNVSDVFDKHTAILHDALYFLRFFYARTIKLTSYEENAINEFTHHIHTQFPLTNPTALAQSIRINVLYALSMRHVMEKHILPRIEGKLAFVQTALYLGSAAIITSTLHEYGFTVIEAQHGMVHRAHPAYNYPDEVMNDANHPARQYLPDIFLSFGSYWERQIRIPCQQISIGYPALMDNVAHLRDTASPIPKQILIVSQWTITHKMVEITHTLSRALPDHHLIFKLHPGEITAVDRYASLLDLSNVTIKKLDNIHSLIAASPMIVGATSTTLFEAQLFPDKRIFVLENDAVPDGIGQAFSTTEELITLIQDNATGYSAYDTQELWADNWQTRIADFLKTTGLAAR